MAKSALPAAFAALATGAALVGASLAQDPRSPPRGAPDPRGEPTLPGPPAAGARGSAGTDQGTAPASDETHALRAGEFFALADHDGNGWISYEEAVAALGLDRDGFGRYDTDRDGRISFAEYWTVYQDSVARGGAVERPRGAPPRPVPPVRDAGGLLLAYDADLNGALSSDELETMIGDYRIRNLSGALVLSQFDGDGTGRLERGELEYLAVLLGGLRGQVEPLEQEEPADSLEALFGTPMPRPRGPGSVPAPARITGPVEPFHRLDSDGNGAIDARDLESLQFPLTLSVRPATVLAALDRDGDGQLSPAELRFAFEAPQRTAADG